MIFRLSAFFCIAIGISLSASPTDWDYLILSLRWGPTLCSFTECTPLPKPIDFSVHGLWPSVYPDEMPTKCKSGMPFDEKRLAPLKPELLQHWPNLRPHSNTASLWQHEWEKHGECATEDEIITTEHDYFRLSLELRNASDIMGVLLKNGITPNNDTILQQDTLRNVFVTSLKARVQLYCLKHHHQTSRLVEVRLCFTSQLKLRDCVEACPASPDSTADTCKALPIEPPLNSIEKEHSKEGFSYSAMPCPPGDIIFPSAGDI